MIIGIMKEIKENEYRVAAVPETVKELTRRGHAVYVEEKAGEGSGFSDEAYRLAGAVVASCEEVYQKAELIYKVKEIFPEEYPYMKPDKILLTYIHSNAYQEMTKTLLESGITSIAYEDVTDRDGRFPLLKPMSELAGKGGFLAGIHFAQTVNGGTGVLFNNICGVKSPIVTIIGAGNTGRGAAELAAAFGNEVRMLDVSMESMEEAKRALSQNVSFLFSNRTNLEWCLRDSDMLINCILWDKTRKDHLVNRKDLSLMKPGAIIVDVACDDGGAIETCHSTTHADPVYTVDGIIHYAVDNIPSAFAKTASTTLANATLPYVLEIAGKGVVQALKDNPHLRRGLTTYKGKLTLEETARKYGWEYTAPEELL